MPLPFIFAVPLGSMLKTSQIPKRSAALKSNETKPGLLQD